MGRIQTLLGADHQFNLTSPGTIPNNDGYHNLIHMTQQAPSAPLAATGRLYVKSAGGFINLFYMDDAAVEYQITPIFPAPLKLTGSVTVGGFGTSPTIYTVPSYTQGTIFVNYTSPSTSIYTYNLFFGSGTGTVGSAVLNSGGTNPPTISFSGHDMRVVNHVNSTRTISYWINVVSF